VTDTEIELLANSPRDAELRHPERSRFGELQEGCKFDACRLLGNRQALK
jgi:hypothetical protein